jgi:hypothetical protein
MPNVRDSSARSASAADVFRDHRAQHLYERHRGRDLPVTRALQQAIEVGERRRRQGRRLTPALRQVTPERGATLVQVLLLRTTVSERDEWHFRDLVVGHRNVEAIAELPQRLLRHLFRLVADHLPLARLVCHSLPSWRG